MLLRLPNKIINVQVISQAHVLCSIYVHDAWGQVGQGTSAWDLPNMLHFMYSVFLNVPLQLSICFSYIVRDTICDCGFICFNLIMATKPSSQHNVGLLCFK